MTVVRPFGCTATARWASSADRPTGRGVEQPLLVHVATYATLPADHVTAARPASEIATCGCEVMIPAGPSGRGATGG
jgi:hypothetical protein